MPVHTPSPHRFLAPNPSSSQKQNSKPKPQSSLRHGFTVQTPKPTLSLHKKAATQEVKHSVTPAKRFVIAPPGQIPAGEQQHAQRRKGLDETCEDTPTQPTPRPKPPRKSERVESIEEASSQSSPSGPARLDYRRHGLTQSIEPSSPPSFELENCEPNQENVEDEEMLFIQEERNKRRRLSSQPPTSPTRPALARKSSSPLPETPAPASHRFKVPTARTPAPFPNSNIPTAQTSITTTATPHTNSRPHFRLPPKPPSPQKHASPLPETFSPSRKSQKFIPNGLASTVQSWIVETANTSHPSAHRGAGVMWGHDKEDGLRIKLRISELRAGGASREGEGGAVECYNWGMVFARGHIELVLGNSSRARGVVQEPENESKCVMLAGQGSARGKEGVKLREGVLVGLRAPIWEVDSGGERWCVGVDWVVL